MKKNWPYGTTKVATYAVFFLIGLTAMIQVSCKCKPDENEVCSTDPSKPGCFCKRCISCPEGYGPSHPCGERYGNGTVMRCKPCFSGTNYSEEHSIASCQPCPQCGGRKTLQKCTPKRETSCSTECRVGYIMSYVVDDCIPDPSFQTTPQQIDKAKLTITPDLPKITAILKTTTSTFTRIQREAQATVKPLYPDPSGKDRQSSKDSDLHSRDNKTILIVMCSIILTAIGVLVVYIAYKRSLSCHNDEVRNEDEEMALTSKESPRTSQENIEVPWENSLRLRDIPDSLCSDIATQISKECTVRKYWRNIGKELKLSEEELDEIDVAGHNKTGTNKGLLLFLVLKTSQPELTLTKFVLTLDNLKRKDVSVKIRDHYQKLNMVIHKEGPQDDQQPDHV